MRGVDGAALALGAGAWSPWIAVHGWDYPVEDLSPDKGGPLLLVDRNGLPLAQIPSQDGRPGRHAWVELDQVPAVAIATFLVSEDEGFFEHGGVDLKGIGRAAWLDLGEARFGYGGSTITMQLVRMIHSAGQERSLGNKIKEAVLAMRLERAVSKETILEQYINRAYFGNGAYGIEAGAQAYFGKPGRRAQHRRGDAARRPSPRADRLRPASPPGPRARPPRARVRPAARARRAHRRRDRARPCPGAHADPPQAAAPRPALRRLAAHHPALRCPREGRRRPHHARPRAAGADGGGGRRTRRNARRPEPRPGRRHRARHRLRPRPRDGRLARSAGAGGQINITTLRRHPGSSLKPFVYAQAIERGDSPATIAYDIHDVPSAYRVVKLTQPERGPVRYREALAGSYNLAAVHTLEKVGVERMLTTLRRAGVGPLAGRPRRLRPRLALGSAQVRLLDLASAYGFLVRGGTVRAASGVRDVTSWTVPSGGPERPRDTRVFSPETSWLVMDMLSDPEARRPAFGQELPIDLPSGSPSRPAPRAASPTRSRSASPARSR
jgi:membrane peptidoglycan carboxypeptidase